MPAKSLKSHRRRCAGGSKAAFVRPPPPARSSLADRRKPDDLGRVRQASLLRHYRKEGLSLQKMRSLHREGPTQAQGSVSTRPLSPLDKKNRQLVYDLQLDVDLDPRLYLVRLTEGDQLQLAPPVEQWVKQIEWEGHIPRRFLPLSDRSPIRVDPEIAYGLPQIRGIRGESLAEGVLAGEGRRRVADLWRATVNEVRAAVSWERSLAAA